MSGGTSPVRALLGRGSIYTASLAIQLVSATVSLPLVTRLLSTREYGIVALGYVVLGLTSGAGTAGLHLVIGRSYFAEADGRQAARRLVSGAFGIAVAVGLIVTATSHWWIAAFGHVAQPRALMLAGATTVPCAVVAVCGSFLRAEDRAARFVALQLVSGIGGTFAGIAAVAIDRSAGAVAYWVGVAAGMVVAALLGLAWIRPWLAGRVHWPEFSSALRIGLPLVPQGVAWLVLGLGDRWVIQTRLGSSPVGRYQVAYTMGGIGLAIVTALSTALPPIIFGAADDGRWRALQSTLRTVRTLTAPIAVALAAGGPVVLHAVTPRSYNTVDVSGVVAALAASALPWAIYGFMSYALIWSKKTGVIAWATGLAAAVNLPLVWLLLPPLGLDGAAIATLAAYWLLAWLMLRAARPIVQVRTTVSEWSIWGVASALIVLGALAPVAEGWLAVRIALTIGALAAGLLLVRRLVRDEGGELGERAGKEVSDRLHEPSAAPW